MVSPRLSLAGPGALLESGSFMMLEFVPPGGLMIDGWPRFDLYVITAPALSAGTKDEAKRAQKEGADYVGVGPVFRTATKPCAGDPLGLEVLAEIAAAVSIPVVAIGGINVENVARVFEAGASGAAVISAVVSAEDITAAARALKRVISQARRAARPARPSP